MIRFRKIFANNCQLYKNMVKIASLCCFSIRDEGSVVEKIYRIKNLFCQTRMVYYNGGQGWPVAQSGKGYMGSNPIISARRLWVVPQDDEEKSNRTIRRVLFCGHGRVIQLTNMQATAKQRDCNREERQISACLSFD